VAQSAKQRAIPLGKRSSMASAAASASAASKDVKQAKTKKKQHADNLSHKAKLIKDNESIYAAKPGIKTGGLRTS
jgi:hypothetical protein